MPKLYFIIIIIYNKLNNITNNDKADKHDTKTVKEYALLFCRSSIVIRTR